MLFRSDAQAGAPLVALESFFRPAAEDAVDAVPGLVAQRREGVLEDHDVAAPAAPAEGGVCLLYTSKKKKFHSTKSIVAFADERIVSFEELEPEERIYCSMLSNLILGGALLIIGLIAGAV